MVKPISDPNSDATARRRLPAPERRQQILRCALPLFAHQGYAATGTRELAAAAGVTEPVLYRHFENKAALFQAAVEAAGEQIRGALTSRAAAEDFSGQVRSLADQLPALLSEQHEALSVLLHASLSGDACILQAGGRAAEQIGQLLSDALVGSGLRSDVSPRTAGFALFQIGMGASILHRMPVPTMDDEAYTGRVVEMLLAGMSA